MKIETLLKTALLLLVVALAVTITSWVTSTRTEVRAEGGGGGAANAEWMMVASELRSGEGLVYLFNTQKQVMLIYAYHRGRRAAAGGRNTFEGDFQFLAGRHCKWDLLYCELVPYPMDKKAGMITPKEMMDQFQRAIPKVPG